MDGISDNSLETTRAFGIRRVLASLVLVGLLVAGGFLGLEYLIGLKTRPKTGSHPLPRTTLLVRPVRFGPYRETLKAYGVVRALHQADVAAEVAGRVLHVAPSLKAGSSVHQGEEVVVIDDQDLKQALRNAQAVVHQRQSAIKSQQAALGKLQESLQAARQELAVSKRQLASSEALARTNSFAKNSVDQQRLATSVVRRMVLGMEERIASMAISITGLKANLEAARAQQRRAELNLRRARVAVPWTGVVEKKQVHEGSRVVPGSVLFTLVDPRRVEVPISCGASHFAELGPDTEVALKLREGGPVVWHGKVTRKSPVLSSRERSFMLYAEVAEKEAASPIPPGTFVIALVAGSRHGRVMPLPRAALVENSLFVVAPDPTQAGQGIVRRRRPQIEKLLPGIALVSGGLKVGELVVLSNVEELVVGTRVLWILEAQSQATPEGDGR